MSNYYEILGVWRDASEDDIDLAAQAVSDHWKGALALNDPLAADWLKIIEQACSTLIDPASREIYDRQLADQAEQAEEPLVYSPGFPWRPYLCALIAVPTVLAAFLLILAVFANSASLTNASAFSDALLTTMLVASAVAVSCGIVVIWIASRVRAAQHELRLMGSREAADPAELARIEGITRMSEFTDIALWVTWIAEIVVTALWVWLAVLVIASV
ncbi:MAG: hypothetical protein ABSC51_08835 [Gaiellaceae bacterium]|jgi:NADH:ubiquinone oxidoreductase subunit K